jgi:hypothetical protein
MRSLTKNIIDKDVYLMNNAPITLTNGKFGDGGFPNTGGWNAGNPTSIPPIQYYLKDRLNSGDIKVEIYDAAGKLVQTIPGTKRKGINKVYWNLHMKPPKVATGGTKVDFGGFIAPMVLPGNYTVKLKVGDKEYSNPITLVHDESNKTFTTTDRQLQFTTAMQLYNLHEQLAKTVDDINDKQKMLKENIEKTKNAKLKKLLQDYNNKLEELRGTLLATKQKSIFADEERLREKITDVYSAVVGQESAPGNLQQQRVQNLQQDVNKAGQTNDALTKQYYQKIKESLLKEGLIKPETTLKDNQEK